MTTTEHDLESSTKEKLLKLFHDDYEGQQIVKHGTKFFAIPAYDLDFDGGEFCSYPYSPGDKIFYKKPGHREKNVGTAVDLNALSREQLLDVISGTWTS
jgi:hypothetical protein